MTYRIVKNVTTYCPDCKTRTEVHESNGEYYCGVCGTDCKRPEGQANIHAKQTVETSKMAYCKDCGEETQHIRDDGRTDEINTYTDMRCRECGKSPTQKEEVKIKRDQKAMDEVQPLADIFLGTRGEKREEVIEPETSFEIRPDPINKQESCIHGDFFVSHPCESCGTSEVPKQFKEGGKMIVDIGFGTEVVDPEKWSNDGHPIKPNVRRIIVCGGRDYTDSVKMFRKLDEIFVKGGRPVSICHGGARGADSIAGAWAKMRNIECTVFPADWANQGKAAGMIRNRKMIEEFKPELVVVFPGGVGTAHMKHLAIKAQIKGIEIK